ncbi:MAG TPA: insulinase family protein [bacterium]|nr:insulinase family protein [bacterium]
METGFRKTTLENGLRVLSETMTQTRSVSVGVWIRGGSRSDPPSCMGLTHFLEHMLFKGTLSRSAFEIATHLERLGGHLNAFTEKEFICLHATVLDEFLPQAVEILADLVRHARLDGTDFDTEKQVILEEIHALEDTPEEWIHELFLDAVIASHPLGLPILGTRDSLQGISRDAMQTFREKSFTADHLLVSAAGNLRHETLTALVSRFFADMSRGDPIETEPVRFGPAGTRTHRSPINQSHFCLGGPGIAYSNPDKFPLILLSTYLGGGMSSRLFQTVREKLGLAYSIYSFSETWSDSGIFGVYAGTSDERMPQALEAVEAELDAVLRQGIPKPELDGLKSQLRGNLLLSHENVHSRMGRIARMETYTADYMPLDEVIGRILRVGPDDIRRIAEALLNPSARHLVALRSEE